MKSLIFLTAAVVAAATLATAAVSQPEAAAVAAPAPAHYGTTGTSTTSTTSAAEVRAGRQVVALFRHKTWVTQDRIPAPRTPTRYMERHTRGKALLHWLKHRWHSRWLKAKHRLAAHLLPMTNDWVTAVRIVQRVWPGTSAWLLSCSGGEGSHGVWVWNGGTPLGLSVAEAVRKDKAGTLVVHGSGAGGWMQFMEGTFDSQFAAAMYAARTTHRALPPPQSRNWFSALGQAFAAGRSRYIGSTGAWDPGIDPRCA